jgi:hypothetical protein
MLLKLTMDPAREPEMQLEKCGSEGKAVHENDFGNTAS